MNSRNLACPSSLLIVVADSDSQSQPRMSNIDKYRREAADRNVAIKILNRLDSLKREQTDQTSRRCIWELIQNAKDVSDDDLRIQIELVEEEDDRRLVFYHSGSPFTDRDIAYLIQQVSTKDRPRSDEEPRTTGRFGTGFLVTHLLSEVVTVSGLRQVEGGGLILSSSSSTARVRRRKRSMPPSTRLSQQPKRQLRGSMELKLMGPASQPSSASRSTRGVSRSRKSLLRTSSGPWFLCSLSIRRSCRWTSSHPECDTRFWNRPTLRRGLS